MMDNIFVSDIQRFSLDDGPGIRTTVFFKGCNLHCPWCHNPETISRKPVLLYNSGLCVKCGVCASECGQKLPLPFGGTVDCSGCGACVCPNHALKLSGKHMSIEDICAKALEDAEFYAASGGGVTLSGGEPLLWPQACALIAERCHKNNIGVLLDTAGCVSLDIFKAVAVKADEVYFDFKTLPMDFKTVCGGDFSLVEQNLKWLIAHDYNFTLRVPLIPHYSAEPDYALRMAQYAACLGIKVVQLLQFNPLADGKYRQMGLAHEHCGFMDESSLQAALKEWQKCIPGTILKQ